MTDKANKLARTTVASAPATHDRPANKRLMTVAEFERDYATSHTETYRLLAEGAIRAVKRGKNTLIVCESAEAWRESLPPYRPERVA